MFEITIPFGVELEFSSRCVEYDPLHTAVRQALDAVGGQELGRDERLDRWTLKGDGSCGHELTTPVLKGQSGLRTLTAVVKDLQARFRGRDLVDTSCGLHVHLDTGDLTRNQLKGIFQAFAKMETFLLKMVPNSRNGNSYCSSVSRYMREAGSRGYEDAQLPHSHSAGVNIADWYHRGSMEIRYASGTCDHRKIVGWICMMEGIVNKALEVGPPSRQIEDLHQFWRYIGRDHDSAWDRRISNWINQRYEYLQEHDPQRFRRVYQEARRIRDQWEDHMLRQYHYHIRRSMTREERREHDRMIIDKHNNGEELVVPEEYYETYYDAFPDRRPEEDREGPGETEPATTETEPASVTGSVRETAPSTTDVMEHLEREMEAEEALH